MTTTELISRILTTFFGSVITGCLQTDRTLVTDDFSTRQNFRLNQTDNINFADDNLKGECNTILSAYIKFSHLG